MANRFISSIFSKCNCCDCWKTSLLGIIVPHVVRKLIGGNYRVLIPFSTVIGAWLLLVADLLGRVIQPPLEIPANAILMIVGGPMLIYLICQRKRNRI